MNKKFQVINKTKRQKEKEVIVFKDCCLLNSTDLCFYVLIVWLLSSLIVLIIFAVECYELELTRAKSSLVSDS